MLSEKQVRERGHQVGVHGLCVSSGHAPQEVRGPRLRLPQHVGVHERGGEGHDVTLGAVQEVLNQRVSESGGGKEVEEGVVGGGGMRRGKRWRE